ncbi:MAG TPA: hypothetical protein VF841_07410 [Anaeromyxobacter sp.]
MRETTVRFPDLMLLVGTRVALGVGIGLLVGGRLDERTRKGAGAALLIVGALTTVPILLNVRGGSAGLFAREAEARRRGEVGPGTARPGGGAVEGAPTP